MMPTSEDPEQASTNAEAPEPAGVTPGESAATDALHTDGTGRTRVSWWWLLLLVLLIPIAWKMLRHDEITSNNPTVLMTQSLQYAQTRQYQKCIDAARRALDQQPGMAEAYNNIGWCSASMGQWDEGIRDINAALKISPDYSLAKNNLAWMLGEKDKASSHPRAAASPADAAMNHSLEFAQTHRYQECIDAARQALQLHPDMPEAYNNIGWCSASMGQWDEGIRNIHEALRLQPGYQLATNNLAWMLSEKAKAAGGHSGSK
ncbi:MAG: tetratricopeptide repeat protein [Candidatus Sulfopaludibacter sp.]|nr:tetratricopeptide repeat protein [Candidatus Sulfopaludibacter sp.]